MSNKIQARQDGDWLVVSLTPDVCKTPRGSSTPAVPYPVTAKLGNAVQVVPSVRNNGKPVVVFDQSQIPTTLGAEAGTAKGVQSGTVNDICEPKSHSSTVRAGGKPVLREGDEFWMNKRNTVGQVVYVPKPSAAAADQSNPPVQPESNEEAGTGLTVIELAERGVNLSSMVNSMGEWGGLTQAGLSGLSGDWANSQATLIKALDYNNPNPTIYPPHPVFDQPNPPPSKDPAKPGPQGDGAKVLGPGVPPAVTQGPYSLRVDLSDLLGVDPETGRAITAQPYEFRTPDGRVYLAGMTDPSGKTDRIFTSEPKDVYLYVGDGACKLSSECDHNATNPPNPDDAPAAPPVPTCATLDLVVTDAMGLPIPNLSVRVVEVRGAANPGKIWFDGVTDSKGKLPLIENLPLEMVFSVQLKKDGGDFKSAATSKIQSPGMISTLKVPRIRFEFASYAYTGSPGAADHRKQDIVKKHTQTAADTTNVSRNPPLKPELLKDRDSQGKSVAVAKYGLLNMFGVNNLFHPTPPKPKAAPAPAAAANAPASAPASKPPAGASSSSTSNTSTVAAATQTAKTPTTTAKPATTSPAPAQSSASTSASTSKGPIVDVEKVQSLISFAMEQVRWDYKSKSLTSATIVETMKRGTFIPPVRASGSGWGFNQTLGRCTIYVKVALWKAGYVDFDEEFSDWPVPASQLGPSLLKAGFTDVTTQLPDARWAAPGDVLVYQKLGDASAEGHVDIRSYDGYISDFYETYLPVTGYVVKGIYRKYFDPIAEKRMQAFLRIMRKLEAGNVLSTYGDQYTYRALPKKDNVGDLFSGFDTHPAMTMTLKPFTASGAYGITLETWKDAVYPKKSKAGVFEWVHVADNEPKFNPKVQDRIAIQAAEMQPAFNVANNQGKNAISYIRSGDIVSASKILLKKWPSLPGGSQTSGGYSIDKLMEDFNEYSK